MLIEYQVRIRTRANDNNALVVSSIRGGTNPYLEEPPRGDGASVNPLTGESICASYTGKIVDVITGGTSRVVTSQLEDVSVPTSPQQQLGFRVTYVEMRIDGGAWIVLCVGYLVILRLASAITWEFTVQDATRVVGGFQAFTTPRTMTLAAALAQWPTRGCVFGGPLTQEFMKVKATIGRHWLMMVHRATDTFTGGAINPFPGLRYYLEFLMGSGPTDWKTKLRDVTSFADQVNNSVQGLFQFPTVNSNLPSFLTVGDALTYGWWSGLVLLIRTAPDAAPVFYRPIPDFAYGINLKDDTDDVSNPFRLVRSARAANAPMHGALGLIGELFGIRQDALYSGIFTIQDGQPELADKSIVFVQCLTIQPTEASPIYWDGHPADLLKVVWDQVGLPYHAVSVNKLKNATDDAEPGIGPDQIALRITGQETESSFLQTTVYAPFGVGVRIGTQGDASTTGKLVPFLTRGRSKELPTITVTDADVVQGEVKLPFELDTATGLNTITLTQRVLRIITDTTPSRNLDGITSVDVTATEINSDSGAVPSGTLALTVGGMLHAIGSKDPFSIGFLARISADVFDRHGRGNVQGETLLIRGGIGDSLNLGDEALVNISQLPNHNKRIGDDPSTAARRMQAIRITDEPRGRMVRWSDSGPNANPITTVPVLSIALTADLPRSWVQFTITNAAALNTEGHGVRVQFAAVAAGSPAPANKDFGHDEFFKQGAVPTTAQRKGAFLSGQTVYARAQARNASFPASNFGAVVNVTLSSVPNPSGLTATPVVGDGSLCLLKWTPGGGSAADEVDIFLRFSGQAFSAAHRVQSLARGATQYMLQNLTPATSFIATVQYRDPSTHDVSDPIDVGFTTTAAGRVLSAPIYPFPFAGSVGEGIPRLSGVFGIAVLSAEFPGLVEVAMAIESGVGTDSYGTFQTQPTPVASVLGNWTIYSLNASNDGRRRRLKARHVGDGATASAYTDVVTVLPWSIVVLPPLPTTIFIEVTTVTPDVPGEDLRFQVAGVDPLGTIPQVEVVSISTTASIVDGPAVAVLSPNDTQWEIALPASGDGPGIVTVRAQTPDGRFADAIIPLPEAQKLGQLALRIKRRSADMSTICVEIYVADPQPSVDPLDVITIVASSQGVITDDAGIPLGGGVVSEDPTHPTNLTLAAELIPPGDVVTASLDTTDFVTFRITRPALFHPVTGAINPSGLVSFTATRVGYAPAVQSINIEPKGAGGVAAPGITTECEGTARDGNGEGQIRLIIALEPNTTEVHIFASESETPGGAVPGSELNSQSATIRRREGIIAGDDYWITEFDISTTEFWYRQVTIANYSGSPDENRFARLPPTKFFERQAIDSGTAPTSVPVITSVVSTIFNGEPRNTVTWTNADTAASVRVFRNGSFLKRFAPTVHSFADDGLTPGVTYKYSLQSVRNGQTSEFSNGGAVDGITTPLSTPAWAPNSPKGGLYTTGILSNVFVNARVATPGADTTYQVWMNDTATDSGTFTFTGVTIDPGSSDATILGDVVGASGGTQRWFYLRATRPSYTPSSPSTHKTATFGSNTPPPGF